MSMTIGRRRRVIVDKRLQFGFLLVCLSYIATFTFMVGVALFIPLMVALSSNQQAVAESAASQILLLHGSFWPAVLVSLVLLLVHALLVSHRFAGPLYRHKLIYKGIASGKIPATFAARKGDFLRKETEGLNEMIESLRLGLQEIQAAEFELDEALAKLRGSDGAATDDGLSDKLAAVAEAQEKLRSRIDCFQIGT